MDFLPGSLPYQILKGYKPYEESAIHVKAQTFESKNLNQVDSSDIFFVPSSKSFSESQDFLRIFEEFPLPRIQKSPFLPEKIAEELLGEEKSHFNIFDPFISEAFRVLFTGDFELSQGNLTGHLFPQGYFREVILCTSERPSLFEIDDISLLGKDHKNLQTRSQEELKEYLVFHLTNEKFLPAKSEIPEENQLNIDTNLKETKAPFSNQYLNIENRLYSLEMLYQTIQEQVRNELSLLEDSLTQGYIYTIDTFHSKLLDSLKFFAFQNIQKGLPIDHLKLIVLSEEHDPTLLHLYQSAFPNTVVLSKKTLYESGSSVLKNPYALVIHAERSKIHLNTTLNYSNAKAVLKNEQHYILKNHLE